MLFPRHPEVDGVWSTIGQSVAGGPLQDAGVTLAKVAPSPKHRGGREVSLGVWSALMV